MRKVMAIAVLLLTMVAARAQNCIDGLIEKSSLVGSGTFTSAVERDPATRKVKKVVKMLELGSTGSEKFEKAFRQEARQGDFTETVKGDRVSLLLTVDGQKSTRVYMLVYNRRTHSGGQVTIVVNFK